MITEMSDPINESTLCLALAELFFLDNEPSEMDFNRVTNLLNENHWTREQTRDVLVQLIAPNAGANLGFLIYPTVGEWAGFNQNSLYEKIQRSKKIRSNRPKWYFFLSDWWCGRMLRKLGMDRLLCRLS
jgi:hypothetical protein